MLCSQTYHFRILNKLECLVNIVLMFQQERLQEIPVKFGGPLFRKKEERCVMICSRQSKEDVDAAALAIIGKSEVEKGRKQNVHLVTVAKRSARACSDNTRGTWMCATSEKEFYQ